MLYLGTAPRHTPLAPTPPCIMKPPPNPQRSSGVNANANASAKKNGATTQVQWEGLITTPDLQAHLERLQGVSVVASRIFALLGEQITSVSSTIPVQRGHETVYFHPPPPLLVVPLTRFDSL